MKFSIKIHEYIPVITKGNWFRNLIRGIFRADFTHYRVYLLSKDYLLLPGDVIECDHVKIEIETVDVSGECTGVTVNKYYDPPRLNEGEFVIIKSKYNKVTNRFSN